MSTCGLPTDIQAVRDLLIGTPSGAIVPLRDAADVYFSSTPNVIQHENGSRRIDVSCNVRGRNLGSVAWNIEAKTRAIAFDPGYHPEFLGEYAAREESRRRLTYLALLSPGGILLML